MVKETHLYDILSVSINSSIEEISRSFKKQALKCHPDKTNHNPQLTEKFKEIKRAYEILKDDKQRYIYDNFGEEGLESMIIESNESNNNQNNNNNQSNNANNNQNNSNYTPNTQFQQFFTSSTKNSTGQKRTQQFQQQGSSSSSSNSQNFNSNDIFSQVFQDLNSMFSNSNSFFQSSNSFDSFTNFQSPSNFQQNFTNSSFQQPPPQQQQEMKKIIKPYGEPLQNQLVRGDDIRHVCDVTLEDLMYGKTLKLSLPKNSKCSNCNGYGGINPKICKTCLGSGQILIIQYNQFSSYKQTNICTSCQGNGIKIKPIDKCIYCNGEGYMEITKILKIYIPPGTHQGSKIILKEESDEGKNIIPGDLIIIINQKPHKYLIRKNNDLFMNYEIDLKTALLGGFILIPNFLKMGQFLKIYINSTGNQQHKNSSTSSQQQNNSSQSSLDSKKISNGEIIGTIQNNEPKLVKNLGMPISTQFSNGILIQDSSNLQLLESTNTNKNQPSQKRGNLYINFQIKLPKISQFSQQNLDLLENILPNNLNYIPSPTERIIESNLSNIPDSTKNINLDSESEEPIVIESPPQQEQQEQQQSEFKRRRFNSSESNQSLNNNDNNNSFSL
ncbi:hypothetical protein KGF54_000037 [Candida jiufengensis]|uniref:uncharacterized protein n=1 Tax=Candida jiufengensis TaxID=497108 RepID=UPI002224465A|nr:uncharacterized protein KGF54_000037 [Candida jiufengensis]KAI5957109.1 hypothetical protein KGF54_000037 [Candida jiufengensis]